MTRILIADDHALVRAGLKQFLQEDRRDIQVAEASSGQQTLDMLRGGNFDLLILDINMPDRGGLDILKHVRSGHPNTKVLVLSGYPERQYAVNVLKAGASGYLSKDGAPAELTKAVAQVLAGKRYVSASLAEIPGFGTRRRPRQAAARRSVRAGIPDLLQAGGRTIRLGDRP